jgi:hypothetical protein
MSITDIQVADTSSDLTTSHRADRADRTGTQHAGGSRMTLATGHRRPWLLALNMFLAVAALVISVIALATTTDSPTNQVPASRTPMDSSPNPLLPGCQLGLGVCDSTLRP